MKSSPVISVEDDKPYIYFTEAILDGSIYCLNPDGTLTWHYNSPADNAYTMQGAALSDGKVYYGTDNGYLYCIGQGEALPPVANFSSDKQASSFPMTVFFKDRSFNANKFLWDFGDGSTGIGQIVEHTFKGAGTYNVVLNVTNSNGIGSSDAKVITVTSAQGPALTITKAADPTTYSTAGQKIKYTYIVTNSGTVPIKNIKVTDNKISISISSATLAPGSSVTGTGAHNIKQGDYNSNFNICAESSSDNNKNTSSEDLQSCRP